MAGVLVLALIVAGLTILGAAALAFGVDSRFDVSDTRGVSMRPGIS
jgi:hypothetical protein